MRGPRQLTGQESQRPEAMSIERFISTLCRERAARLQAHLMGNEARSKEYPRKEPRAGNQARSRYPRRRLRSSHVLSAVCTSGGEA